MKKQIVYNLSLILLIVLFWQLVVFNLGVLQALFIHRAGKIPDTLVWWESELFKNHLFSIVYNKNDIAQNRIYISHSTFSSLLDVFWIKSFSYILHKPYHIAQNFIALVNMYLFIVFIFSRDFFKNKLKTKFSKFDILMLFLIVGFIFSIPSFWDSFLRFNSDNYFVLTSLLLIFLTERIDFLNTQSNQNIFFITGIIMVSFEPVYYPCWLFLYFAFLNTYKITVREYFKTFILLLYSVLIIIVPYIQGWLIHKENLGSTFKSRSGLDGSSLYFKSVFDALFKPFSHNFNFLWLVYFIVLLILMILFDKSRVLSNLKRLGFALIGFVFSLIVFPQSVSIHRYLYDFLLFIPIVYLIIKILIEIEIESIQPRKFLFIVLGMIFMIFVNLRSISVCFYNW